MKLRKIEVVGFKSFADREVIHVDERVTSVIGPNGCGKSNIVDAVRWAMGEQSAKHLRGAGMADVIFAGCATRGAAGMAEVTLTFENQGDVSAAYLDFPEIAVTRRLFGDGTSEYLINKVPARLRDITELLLGTGAGTKGYSIIEQGQVGKLVTSKPEERRHVIDEAAGITRFKAQKAAAERKIEATRQNLLRVTDVIGELETRLVTLRRQAQKAERYRRYREELRDLDLWMASHKYLELVSTGRVLDDRRADLAQQVEDVRTALETRDAQIQAKRLDLAQVERELAERQEAVYALDNRIKLLESENDYRTREREALAKQVAQASAEAEVVQRGLVALESDLAEVTSRQGSLGTGTRPGGEQSIVDRIEEEHRAVLEQIADIQRALVELRDEQGRVSAAMASGETLLQSRTEAMTELERRVAASAGQIAETEAESSRRDRELVDARSELAVATATLEGLRERRSVLDRERATLREQVQGAEVELDTMRAELHRCKSRLQSLEEIQNRYRRCASGVQVVMERRQELAQAHPGGASSSAPATAVLGIMADYIYAPEHLEAAVSAVLGDRLEGVVVDGPGSGVRGVELLKQVQEGRTTFLPRVCRSEPSMAPAALPAWSTPTASPGPIEVVDLSTGEPSAAAESSPLRDVPGVLGRLFDLVTIDPEVLPLARELLGETVVVDKLARALELWQTARGRSTFVTLEGDRIEPSGVVVGGSSQALDSALLQQKREIRELQEIAGELTDAFENARRRHLGLAERLATVELAREDNDRDVLEAEKDRLERATRVEHDEQGLGELRGRLVQLQAERDELGHQLEARRDETTALARTLAELGGRAPAVARALADQEQRLFEVEADRERLAGALTDAKVALAKWQQQSDALAAAHDRISRQLVAEHERIERLTQAAYDGEARIGDLVAATEAARTEHAELVLCSREAAGRVSESRERHDAIRLELGELELSVRNLRNELDEELERLKDVELGLQQIELERQHLEGDVLDRFDQTLVDVLIDFHDRRLAGVEERERHKELKRVIARMGEVNLTAIDECDEVSRRYDYLTGQRADLENAITQLQEAIDRINKTTRQRFKDTFALVNEKFQQVFPRLFNGGRAELRMTDPNDLLGTGVEIHAQPPGKQLRSLELLSGGEKALTATSLVFAIFLIKPSPFCILDEVDAPLDDANVGRFCNLVRELADRTQFIIITHNKITMEAADRLYGVTMEQRGVSKLVSVNMRRAVEAAYN